MQIRVFNYNTLEKVTSFDGHADYIRSLAIHPTLPYILSCSDDMSIKLWDWEKGWKNIMTFEGHMHYVMQVVFNPKDSNTFASASLDRTIKVWSIGASVPNYTLEGHEKGVNCVEYYAGGEKPYIVSGADDRLVKIWDYQNKTCVQTLEGHSQNVSAVIFHPELPIIASGSEDGTVRIWHANTYRLESTLNYGMERVWCLAYLRGSNDIAIGYDEGTVTVKLGREEPAISMDEKGRIVLAKHNEILNASIRATGESEPKDGERVPLSMKESGSCEVYPQMLGHSPNGRFVVVCGDGEYIIYTGIALRNKTFGTALDFAWSADSNEYAIRESSNKIKLFRAFKEQGALKINYNAEGLYGGRLIGVRSNSFLCFYDWETSQLVRRIDVVPRDVFWSASGELVTIACESSFYVLKYSAENVAAALAKNTPIPDDGLEAAFELVSEIQER